MTVLINTITGSSGSMRPKANLHTFIEAIKLAKSINASSTNKLFSGLSNKAVRDSLDFLQRQREVSWGVFIGKSLGGVRTWWVAYKHFDKLKPYLDNGTKLHFILLDPHGPQIGNGKVFKSYGNRNRPLEYLKEWEKYPNFKILSIVQKNKYPRGAQFEDDRSTLYLNKHANHWNVEDYSTLTGKFVASHIYDFIDVRP
jgi:hypothetical protein